MSAESAGLMHNYDVEHNAFGLSDLVEAPEEMGGGSGSRSPHSNGERVTQVYHKPHQKTLSQ